MAIEWIQSYEIGVPEIDKQHKELFNRINNLFEACLQQKGKEEVAKVLNFLGDYVVTHFRDEEKIQLKYSYPKYNEHKKIHDNFIKDVEELKEQFEKDGATGLFVITVNKKVVDWLIQHIGKMDKEIGELIKSKKL